MDKEFKVEINVNSTAILNINAATAEEAEEIAAEIYNSGNINFVDIITIEAKEEK